MKGFVYFFSMKNCLIQFCFIVRKIREFAEIFLFLEVHENYAFPGIEAPALEILRQLIAKKLQQKVKIERW